MAYGSQTLNSAQRNYEDTKRELLAVVEGLKKCRTYLCGAPFVVRTDHKSITWWRNFKNPTEVLARWMQIFDQYDFECVYRPGSQHGNSDGLSRQPQPDDDHQVVETSWHHKPNGDVNMATQTDLETAAIINDEKTNPSDQPVTEAEDLRSKKQMSDSVENRANQPKERNKGIPDNLENPSVDRNLIADDSSGERVHKHDVSTVSTPRRLTEPQEEVVHHETTRPIERVMSTWMPRTGLEAVREETGNDRNLAQLRSWLMHLTEPPSKQRLANKPKEIKQLARH